MDLVLHRVDGRGRVNLDGIVAPGVEFYTATMQLDDGDETGDIILSPVKIATTAVKRATITTDDPGDYSARS